jgi:hypothetical protein
VLILNNLMQIIDHLTGCNSLWAGNLTGTSMNPANEILSYVMFFRDHPEGYKIWIFGVGPIIGALVGASFYRFVLKSSDEISSKFQDGRYVPPEEHLLFSQRTTPRIPYMSQSSV